MASTWSGPGILPPPPGEEANFVDPQNHQSATIALHTVCLALATCALVLRVYTRSCITHSIGADDFFCVIGYCFAVTFSALLIWGGSEGLGLHIWDLTFVDLQSALKALTIAEYFYILAAAFIKLSCLLFYYRVFFPDKKTRTLIWAGIACVSLAYFIILLTTIFDCLPVAKSWDPLVPGHCLPPKGLPYASGAINVVTDIYVLILPLPLVWKLNMNLSRKLRTIGIFGLGAFVCAMSIVRLAQTHVIYQTTDTTWNLFGISIWSVIEIDVGIMCSCLLAAPAFVEHHRFSRLSDYISTVFSRKSSSLLQKSTKVEAGSDSREEASLGK